MTSIERNDENKLEQKLLTSVSQDNGIQGIFGTIYINYAKICWFLITEVM